MGLKQEHAELTPHCLGVLSRWYNLRKAGGMRSLVLKYEGTTLWRATSETVASGFQLMEFEVTTFDDVEQLVKEAEDGIRKTVGSAGRWTGAESKAG